MCGIVGYTGRRRAVPIIIEGLRRLEYRGYDSAGVACRDDADNGRILRRRARGKLVRLEELLEDQDIRSTTGLGHTRWATHGAPSEDNAHPHCDCSGDLVVVHNGIIENHRSLKEELIAAGHCFSSDTDTEVLAHLIETELDGDLARAVRAALARVKGSFAIGVLWRGAADTLVAARRHSPLVIGVSDAGSHLASDIPALLPYTREVIFLNDDEMAVITSDSREIMTLSNGSPINREITTVDWNAAMAEKAGYKHFMLKEIFEQPEAVSNTIRGRVDPESGGITLPETGLDEKSAARISRITLLACGTSWHAALIARYWIEKWCRIPVEVDIASEFRYRSILIDANSLVVPISQSGETADTLAGMRRAMEMGARVVAICNVVGSTMTREADGTIYTHAGPEIGVASTKAFTSQLAALFLLTLHLGRLRGSIAPETAVRLAAALTELPLLMEEELRDLESRTMPVAEEFNRARDFIYLGRGMNFPVALEGALKLKEISYIHAEGYPAGELKHGPIALVDREMPILALLPRDPVYDKAVSNAEEVKARRGRLIVVGSRGDEKNLRELSRHVLVVPEIEEDLYPMLLSLPLQLLAYQIANLRGCDVDQPRNLAKSVTVE